MRELFDGEVWLGYSQMYLAAADTEFEYDEAFEGQANALLGAGVPGSLTMLTGTHTGTVPLRIVLAEAEPALEPVWEEVVEASFTPISREFSSPVAPDPPR